MTMRFLSATILVAVAVAVAASSRAARASATHRVSEREWAAVISDWRAHGRFAGRHSCAAVIVARTHAPPMYKEGTPLVHALDLYERKLCLPGNVWAVRQGMSDRDVASVAGAPIPWLSGPHCWSYHATKSGTSVDGLRFCFTGGRVSEIDTAFHL